MEVGFSETIKSKEASVLIVPYHESYYLSEIDRLLAEDTDLDAIAIRRKLRRYLSQAIDRALSDSLKTMDLLVASEPDLLEYIYNGVDYEYLDYQKEEEGSWFKNKLKKKEKQVYAKKAYRSDGQLRTEEITTDRYMSAVIGNPGMMEFLHDKYAHSHVLFINELDLKRDLEGLFDPQGATSYQITAHYSLVDQKGHAVCGGKFTETISKKDAELKYIRKDVFDKIAAAIISEAYVYLGTASPVVEKAAEDY